MTKINQNDFSICVKNIPVGMTEYEFRDIFSEKGKENIILVKIFPQSKYGYAFVNSEEIYSYWIKKKSMVFIYFIV
jgi:RNA recognition motif-containing protein